MPSLDRNRQSRYSSQHPGIHVYCTIYLAGKEYPCISAAFSAPGKVWAVPPVTAPLALPPINDPFGCGEVTGAGETSLAASAVAGKGGKDSRGIIQVRADRSLAGSIAIFQRGKCPFEQKVGTVCCAPRSEPSTVLHNECTCICKNRCVFVLVFARVFFLWCLYMCWALSCSTPMILLEFLF